MHQNTKQSTVLKTSSICVFLATLFSATFPSKNPSRILRKIRFTGIRISVWIFTSRNSWSDRIDFTWKRRSRSSHINLKYFSSNQLDFLGRAATGKRSTISHHAAACVRNSFYYFRIVFFCKMHRNCVWKRVKVYRSLPFFSKWIPQLFSAPHWYTKWRTERRIRAVLNSQKCRVPVSMRTNAPWKRRNAQTNFLRELFCDCS